MDDVHMDGESGSDSRSVPIGLIIFLVVLVLAVSVAIIVELMRPHEWVQGLGPLVT